MRTLICAAILFWAGFISGEHVFATKLILKDGRVLEGNHALLSKVDEKTGTEDDISRRIVVVDDGLRSIFFSKSHLRDINPAQSLRPVIFKTGHTRNDDGLEYYVLGNYANSTPFDEYGRRLLEIHHPGGVEYAEQAITELTPYYIGVTSLRVNNKPLHWNMRMATDSVPREQLTPILMKLIDPQNLEDRLKLVRFYFAGELYYQADAELESIMQDWKDTSEVQGLLSYSLTIRQSKYQQLLDELEFRWVGGQYQFVRKYINNLEQDPELPERLLEPVRQMIRRYDETEQRCQETVASLKQLYETLPELEKNEKIPTIIEEIESELNETTLRRLVTFQLYVNDPQLSAAEKLAIGITGWYAGAEADNSLLALAVMLPETEKLIIAYLRSGHDFLLRQRVLEQLKNQETARPDLIAGILATMKPPLAELLPEETPEFPGHYRLTVPNPLIAPGSPKLFGAAEIQYSVQLPPDYNPHQRYPMIVSLNGLSQTPEMQLDWWAGSWNKGQRMGQATRHGYIVIAPDWNPPEIKQGNYDFSIFSHAAVLCSVKDALKRFNVNTDRIFLSGHGIGGTAAWDIALAHPDMWAGAILFNAVASKYIEAYQSAVRHVPLYFVWGEHEGVGVNRKWNINATVLNRYLLAQSQERLGDVTVVRYIGRGMEGFYEEILHIFEWMNLRQRTTVPIQFRAETQRTWDSFFWWVEMPNLVTDQPSNMFDPIDYPAKGASQKMIKVESELYRATNNLAVKTAPRDVSVLLFLTPEMIDFKTKASVRVNGKRYNPPNGIIEPSIEVMLEDARTRCDRLHPYWTMLNGK